MNNKKALISMILGIVGGLMTFFLMGTVVYIISAALGIAAIVLSVMAKKEIANNKNIMTIPSCFHSFPNDNHVR